MAVPTGYLLYGGAPHGALALWTRRLEFGASPTLQLRSKPHSMISYCVGAAVRVADALRAAFGLLPTAGASCSVPGALCTVSPTESTSLPNHPRDFLTCVAALREIRWAAAGWQKEVAGSGCVNNMQRL